MFNVYMTPWYDCNLACPHCDVRLMDKTSNYAQFMLSFKNMCDHKAETDTYILFGGEPMLYPDRFKEIISSRKIDCVSTNMLLWKKEYTDMFRYTNISIATSYNPQRFTESQYELWLENLSSVSKNCIDVLVLITLTKDLFEKPLEEFLKVIDDLDIAGVKAFTFEPYIGEVEVNGEADEWLISFYKEFLKLNLNIKCSIVEKLDNWNCDCSYTMTLNPVGKLSKGCPQFTQVQVPENCLTCDNAHVCRPCVLQKTCSYPKKFAKWLKENAH